MKHLLTPLFTAGVVLALTGASEAQVRKLSDAELDQVTAGGVAVPAKTLPAVTPQSGPIDFEFKAPAGTRHLVEGTGTVQVIQQQGAEAGRDSIVIRDNAQQHLQSFINVTAVNSMIQVLVNLNISINSTVGAVNQINSSGAGGP